MVLGTCSGLVFAPFNSVYAQQERLLRDASPKFAELLTEEDSVVEKCSLWQRPLVIPPSAPQQRQQPLPAGNVFRLIAADEFFLRPCPHLEMASSASARRVLALPPSFIDSLQEHQSRVKRVQRIISGPHLSPEQKKQVDRAIENKFKVVTSPAAYDVLVF